MNNKLTIAVLRYRTVIKVNWTKQEQIRETPKFWMNQMIIFLWNIAVDTVKDETSDINYIGKNTFFETLCKCNINIQQIMLNRSSNYHFIYVSIQANSKMCLNFVDSVKIFRFCLYCH